MLALLYGHPDQSFYVRQLARHLGGGYGAVQRELNNLSEAGLITKKKIGNQVFFQANEGSPIFQEVKSLVAKTVGFQGVLRSALLPVSDRIRFAFVYGSIANNQERADSDIDLMIIGDDPPYEEIADNLTTVRQMLGREVDPHVYATAEFFSKLKSGNHFLQDVWNAEKVFLIGSEDELREDGRNWVAGEATV